jgi:hypothetical protein
MIRSAVPAVTFVCMLAGLLPAAAVGADAPSATPMPLAQAQWPPPPPARSGGGSLPAQPGGAPPHAGPATSYLPAPQSGPLNDSFGRFRATLPPGAEQVTATYVFALPSAALQVNLSVSTRDELFQNSLRMYPEMMRQSGAQVAQQAIDHRGRQASMIMAKMREPQSGTAMQSLNVFIPGPNLWLQVSGPEQSAAQIEETMRALLDGLQHP